MKQKKNNKKRANPRRLPAPPSSSGLTASEKANLKSEQRGKRKGDPPMKDKLKPAKLRIIGGDMRGRLIAYHGALFTRPMRDSVRENLFNILGKGVKGTIAFDLFAGTGVLAFEALSRGAIRAVAVEPIRKAVMQIRETATQLDIESKFTLISGDAFALAERLLQPADEHDDVPWTVFLSPPYRMWTDAEDFVRLKKIIEQVKRLAPPGSILVVETDLEFDLEQLPEGDWDIRTYGGTHLAFLEPANVCGLSADLDLGDCAANDEEAYGVSDVAKVIKTFGQSALPSKLLTSFATNGSLAGWQPTLRLIRSPKVGRVELHDVHAALLVDFAT